MIESAGLSHSAYLSKSDRDYPVSKGLFHEMSIWERNVSKNLETTPHNINFERCDVFNIIWHNMSCMLH